MLTSEANYNFLNTNTVNNSTVQTIPLGHSQHVLVQWKQTCLAIHDNLPFLIELLEKEKVNTVYEYCSKCESITNQTIGPHFDFSTNC